MRRKFAINYWMRTAAACALLTACATVPYTDRKQFNLISPDQEIKMGAEAYQEILRKNALSDNASYQRRVREIGDRIKKAADKPAYDWAFNVLKGEEVNAFCLPGGKVAFYEGIIPLCEDDNGIAVVMGHEVAHALAHHGAERMSQGLGASLVGEILSEGLSSKSPEVQQNVMQLYGLGAQVGVILPFSRKHESEADKIGLILMAKAGYDPRAAVSFWERMAKHSEGKKPPPFLSTHPSDAQRVENIKEWLPEALTHYQPR